MKLQNVRDDDDDDGSLSSSLLTPSTRARAPSFLIQDVPIISRSKQDQLQHKNELLFGIDEPIENTQQFFGWFARIEEEMELGQEDIYR